MIPTFVVAVALVPLLAAPGLASLPDNPYRLDDTRTCGPRCLVFLDRYLGGTTSYEKVLDRCPPGDGGTSLDTLATAAQGLGYHTYAFKGVSADDLKDFRSPAVVHLDRNGNTNSSHFVVVLGWNERGGKFRIFSPPHYYSDCDANWLAERMSGVVLSVAVKPAGSDDELIEARTRPAHWVLTGAMGLLLASFLIHRIWPAGSRRFGRWAGRVGCLLTAVLVTSCGRPSQQADKSSAVASPYTANLGTLESGTVIRHTFRLTNTGTAPFRIIKIVKSCACQAVSYDSEREVRPGEEVTVGVEVHTEGREGPLAHLFEVKTTAADPLLTTINLNLTANLESRIKVIPSQIMFGAVTAGTPVRAPVRVRFSRPELRDAFVGAEVVGNPHITLRDAGPVGDLLSFEAELDPEAPVGDISGHIRFRFRDAVVPEIRVTVVGRKNGDLRVIPRELTVRRGEIGREPTRLRLVSESGRPFRLTGVNVSTGVFADPPEGAGTSVELTVRLAPVGLGANPSVLLKTDRPDQAEVRVPIAVLE